MIPAVGSARGDGPVLSEAPPEVAGPPRTDDGRGQPPEGPVLVPSVEALPVSPRDRLDQAVRRYQFGESELAIGLLSALVVEETLPDDVRRDARIYLGELLYIGGDKDAARRFFEQVLAKDPGHVIDPFRHPPDVCGFFNYVRAYQSPVLPKGSGEGGVVLIPGVQLPDTLPARPAIVYGGFGAYQFRYHRTGQGFAFLGTQVLALGGNIACWAAYLSDYHVVEGDQAGLDRLNAIRWASIGTAVLGGGSWVVNVSMSSSHWRQVELPRRLRANAMQARAPGVKVSGRF